MLRHWFPATQVGCFGIYKIDDNGERCRNVSNIAFSLSYDGNAYYFCREHFAELVDELESIRCNL